MNSNFNFYFLRIEQNTTLVKVSKYEKIFDLLPGY
jgi:hypothetical protein